jgi:HlyD family secretion protein
MAAAQIEVAAARLEQVRAELDRDLIKAPSRGTVLTIFARTGASLSGNGLLTMADLEDLIVIAEIDESEAVNVTPGQSVRITGTMLDRDIAGRVTKIFNQVLRNERPTTDVLVGRDARIVEAEVQVERDTLPPLVGAEVRVTIDLSTTAAAR